MREFSLAHGDLERINEMKLGNTADTVLMLFATSAVMGVVMSPAGQLAVATNIVFRAGWAAAIAGAAAVDTYKAIKAAKVA